MELRYLGFDQTLNRRTYRFEGLTKGEPSVRYVITADLGMFLKHRIGIQDGPGLCVRKLASGAEAPEEGFQLTNDDFQAEVEARAAAGARKAEMRRNFPRRRVPEQE